ncbi:hypothetical protein Tco_0624858 [Tanacetum coccineum]|uniref:Uncharacterized protein n=1 Tax=Tanacetum coccineum TaxID=301880 RepID=A0ABQ4WF50_9ASTR
MDNSKRGYISMQKSLDLNKTQGASTPEEVKRMQNIPYASAVGSIINLEAELRVDCYCDAGFRLIKMILNLRHDTSLFLTKARWTGKAPSKVPLQCLLQKLNT